MRKIKFRAWDEKTKKMFNVDVLAISPCTWGCSGNGVSLAYQPNVKVMQYTGLRDKNGKEIYERDIVRVGQFQTISSVVFEDGCFYTIVGESRYRLGGFNEDSVEVIGNIYEHHHLLKGDEKV